MKSNALRLIAVMLLLFFCQNVSECQKPKYDSVPQSTRYLFEESIYDYKKPKHFEFVTQQPKTFSETAKETFNKKSIKAISIIVASTLILIPADQFIFEKFNQFSRSINLDPTRKYKRIIGLDLGNMPINVYEAPQNINTFLYSIGEGTTSLLVCAGLYLHGKIKHDYRSLQVSSQLIQSFLGIGITIQILKRISGRETPFASTSSGGKWSPLTSPSVYQKNVPSYDAFPSGHLATMMATTTVLALHYPEKKWIRPIGYSLITLVGFAMVNNGVHWMSDYPIALGIGYIFGKATVGMNRWIRGVRK